MRNAVLLMQEGFFVHFVEQATFAVPRRDSLKKFLSLHFRADITHLDDDKGILALWSRREQNIGVEFTWCAFDTVTKMLDERRRGCAVEATVERK